jgi:hypothetical protein
MSDGFVVKIGYLQILENGWIKKHTWQKRFFILKLNKQFGFTKDVGMAEMGFIDLEKFQGIAVLDTDPELGFAIFLTDQTVVVKASSPSACEDWKAALMMVVDNDSWMSHSHTFKTDDKEVLSISLKNIAEEPVKERRALSFQRSMSESVVANNHTLDWTSTRIRRSSSLPRDADDFLLSGSSTPCFSPLNLRRFTHVDSNDHPTPSPKSFPFLTNLTPKFRRVETKDVTFFTE